MLKITLAIMLFGGIPSVLAAEAPTGRFIYAVERNGEIYSYDMDAGHKQVGSFLTAEDIKEVRGACAIAATGRMYISYIGSDKSTHVEAVDLVAQKVVWNKAYTQSVDRLSCLPDGSRLYVPSNEFNQTKNVMVLDAATGKEIAKVPMMPKSHDSLNNLDGTKVYVETKSTQHVAVIDVASGKVVAQLGPMAGIVGPFTFDADETRLYGNVFGLNGFEIVDIKSGASIEKVTIPGQTPGSGGPRGFLQNHGIGLTPDNRNIWVADGPGTAGTSVHIFDVTKSPATELATIDIGVSCPHWLTFNIRGDYAYVAGPHKSQRENPEGDCKQIEGLPTTVVDVAKREIVGKIASNDGYTMEIDFDHGKITAVGSQYGVGRH